MNSRNILTVIFFMPIWTLGQESSSVIQSEVKSFATDSQAEIYWKTTYTSREQGKKSDFSKGELKLFYYSQGLKNINLTPFPSLLLDQDRIKMIRAANSNRCQKVIKIASNLVRKNPFDLTTLVYYSMCLDNVNGDKKNIYYSRMQKIVESIFDTGNGKTAATAYKIANIGDDKLLIGFLGFLGEQLGDQTIDGKIYSVWEDSMGNKLFFEYLFIFL